MNLSYKHTVYIFFFQACERAEFSKSCNLIGSESGRFFTILPSWLLKEYCDLVAYPITEIFKKLSQQIGVLKKIRSCLPTKQRLLYYNTMIRSVLHYVSSIWTSCDKENLSRVFKLQKRSARVISDVNNQASSVQLLIVYSGFLFMKK